MVNPVTAPAAPGPGHGQPSPAVLDALAAPCSSQEDTGQGSSRTTDAGTSPGIYTLRPRRALPPPPAAPGPGTRPALPAILDALAARCGPRENAGTGPEIYTLRATVGPGTASGSSGPGPRPALPEILDALATRCARIRAKSRKCLGPTRLAPSEADPLFLQGGVYRPKRYPVYTRAGLDVKNILRLATLAPQHDIFPGSFRRNSHKPPVSASRTGNENPVRCFFAPDKIFSHAEFLSRPSRSHVRARVRYTFSKERLSPAGAVFMGSVCFSLSYVLKLYRVTSQKQGRPPVPKFCLSSAFLLPDLPTDRCT